MRTCRKTKIVIQILMKTIKISIMIIEKIQIIVVMKISNENNNTNSNNHLDNGFHNKKNNSINKVLITIAVIILAYKRNNMQKKETLTHTRNRSGKYTWKYFLITVVSLI